MFVAPRKKKYKPKPLSNQSFVLESKAPPKPQAKSNEKALLDYLKLSEFSQVIVSFMLSLRSVSFLCFCLAGEI